MSCVGVEIVDKPCGLVPPHLVGGNDCTRPVWAFVISIAALTTMLVNNLTPKGLILYTGLFLAVCWAWNQLTWYASLFDNGDVFFRGISDLYIPKVFVTKTPKDIPIDMSRIPTYDKQDLGDLIKFEEFLTKNFQQYTHANVA